MAKGSRFPHGEDAKVREMRTAETILNILQDRGKRKLPLDDVYRQLYNPAMNLRSYAKLYPNAGAMTPGMTEETVDGWSMEKVAAIIGAIRDERWQWTPVKRVLIDKPKGGKRPLGLPVWSDKGNRSGIENLGLALQSRHGIPCHYGNIACPTARHLGADPT